ncbi:MAG TPA: hypothetical protein VE860_03945 [Chthoniobacterales bacterium]|nr:hypothetical protein [Chthoniobacterales bacterium]
MATEKQCVVAWTAMTVLRFFREMAWESSGKCHLLRIVVPTFGLSIRDGAGVEQEVFEQTLPRAKRRERHQYPQLTEPNVTKAVIGLPIPIA